MTNVEAAVIASTVLVVLSLAAAGFCSKSLLCSSNRRRAARVPDLGKLVSRFHGIGADVALSDVQAHRFTLGDGFPRWDVDRCLFPVPSTLGKLLVQKWMDSPAAEMTTEHTQLNMVASDRKAGRSRTTTVDYGAPGTQVMADLTSALRCGALTPATARRSMWMCVDGTGDNRMMLWESMLGLRTREDAGRKEGPSLPLKQLPDVDAELVRVVTILYSKARTSATATTTTTTASIPIEQSSPKLRAKVPDVDLNTVTVRGTALELPLTSQSPSNTLKSDTESHTATAHSRVSTFSERLGDVAWQAAPAMTPGPMRSSHKKDLISFDVQRCKFTAYREGDGAARLTTVLRAWVLRHPDLQYRQCMSVIAAVIVEVFAKPMTVPLPKDLYHGKTEDTTAVTVLQLARAVRVFERVCDTFLGAMLHPDVGGATAEDALPAWTRIPVYAASETRCITAFVQILRYLDPQLASCLNDVGLDAEVYAVPFLSTVFADNLSMNDTICLWDLIFATFPDNRFPLFMSAAVIMQTRGYLLGPKQSSAYSKFLDRSQASTGGKTRGPALAEGRSGHNTEDTTVVMVEKHGARVRAVSTTSSYSSTARNPALASPNVTSSWFRALTSSTATYPVDTPTGFMILSKLKEGGIDVNWLEAAKLAFRMWSWAPDSVGQLDDWPLSSHYRTLALYNEQNRADRQGLPLEERVRGSFSVLIRNVLAEPSTSDDVMGMLDEDGKLAKNPVPAKSAQLPIISEHAPDQQTGDQVAQPVPTQAEPSAITVLESTGFLPSNADNLRLSNHVNIIRIARKGMLYDPHGSRAAHHGGFFLPTSQFMTASLAVLPAPLRCLVIGSYAPSTALGRTGFQVEVPNSKRRQNRNPMTQPLLGDTDSAPIVSATEEPTGDSLKRVCRRLAYADIMAEAGLPQVADVLLQSIEDTAHAMAFSLRANFAHVQKSASHSWDWRFNAAIEAALLSLSSPAIKTGTGYVLLDVRDVAPEVHDQWAAGVTHRLTTIMTERIVVSSQIASLSVLMSTGFTSEAASNVTTIVPSEASTFVRSIVTQVLVQHFRVLHVPYNAILRNEAIPESRDRNEYVSRVPCAAIEALLRTLEQPTDDVPSPALEGVNWRQYVNVTADQSMDRRTITPPVHLGTALQGPKPLYPYNTSELAKNAGLSTLHRRPYIRVASAAFPEIADVVGVPMSMHAAGVDPSRLLALRDVFLRCHIPFLSLLL